MATTANSSWKKLVEFVVVAFSFGIFAFTAIAIVYSLVRPDAAGKRDFVEYWAAGQQLIHHKSPYAPEAMRKIALRVGYPTDKPVVVVPNPPIILPIVAPLGFIAAMPAELLWCGGLVGAWALSVWLVCGLVAGREDGPRYLLMFAFAPAMACVLVGQISLLLLLGLALYLSLEKRWPVFAGAALLLCALKPHVLLPFAAVVTAHAITRRRYSVLLGAMAAIVAAVGAALLLDPHAFGEYADMMRSLRVDTAEIPCLSNVLRRFIAPQTVWLEYVPAVVGSAWAVYYFWRRRHAWNWMRDGSLVVLVSFLVAPYSWFTDQCILIPALVYGLYRTRSRGLICVMAVANAVMELGIFGGGTRLLHSGWSVLTGPFWLVWYLLATRDSDAAEPEESSGVILAPSV